MQSKIIIPLPNDDFDPSEVAISWKTLRDAGYEVEFATVEGARAYADPMMISGEGLDPWGWIPGLRKLKLIGLLLRANRDARAAYRALQQDSSFLHPKRFAELSIADYQGLLLPGGHAPKMKPYLEDKVLQGFVADFFDAAQHREGSKAVAAICHGVLLAARSISTQTQRSVLYGRKTTALTWKLEKSAWLLTRYFARFWDSGYYRTYRESASDPEGFWSVESEIKRALKKPSDFLAVPENVEHFALKTNGLSRDKPDDSRCAWVVRDGFYVSARWPGDVHTFAKEFVQVLATMGKGNA